jgi:hypothetical protein
MPDNSHPSFRHKTFDEYNAALGTQPASPEGAGSVTIGRSNRRHLVNSTSSVEKLSYFQRESRGSERLLQKRDAGIEHTLMNDGQFPSGPRIISNRQE